MFHLGHLDDATGTEATVLVVLLAGSVLLPLALLVVALRRGPPPATSPRDSAQVRS